MLARQILAGLCFANDCETETQAELQHQRAKAGVIAAKAIMEFPRLQKDSRHRRGGCLRWRPCGCEPRRNHLLLSCHQGHNQLPYRPCTHQLGVPLIPRMMTELAHSETGIDINPEATIGKHFTIDHGTGVVIGATCIIGRQCETLPGCNPRSQEFPTR